MAGSNAAPAHQHRVTAPAPSLVPAPFVPAGDIHPVARRTTAPAAALDLLTQARAGLDEAAGLEAPNERYATAHLAALRTAAAVLASRARPEEVPRRKAGGPRRRNAIRTAWELLPELAPELTEWSALFASGAGRRARAEAGIPGAASSRDADDLLRDAAMFLRLVERLLALQPVLPRPGTEQPPRGEHVG
ncbi:SAV_6107 family HEPN domain-containing protein [Streptomyces sp. NPDC090052]|uniref:SAV_6107 family HEPN domain-containing protein n=1 Tax=Streptomyces sp. NPDC090052 TaxID=3365931 RepID=UPI00382E12FA